MQIQAIVKPATTTAVAEMPGGQHLTVCWWECRGNGHAGTVWWRLLRLGTCTRGLQTCPPEDTHTGGLVMACNSPYQEAGQRPSPVTWMNKGACNHATGRHAATACMNLTNVIAEPDAGHRADAVRAVYGKYKVSPLLTVG